MEANLTNNSFNLRIQKNYQKNLKIDDKIIKIKDQILETESYQEKGILRQKLQKAKSQKRLVTQKTRHLIGLFKTDLDVAEQSVNNSEKNYQKSASIYARKEKKFLEISPQVESALVNVKNYDVKQKQEDKLLVKKLRSLEKNGNKLQKQFNLLTKKTNSLEEVIQKNETEKQNFQKDTVDQIEADYNELFADIKLHGTDEEMEEAQQQYSLLQKRSERYLKSYDRKSTFKVLKKNELTKKIIFLSTKLNENQEAISQLKAENESAINRAEELEKDQKLLLTAKTEQAVLKSEKKLLSRYERTWQHNQKNYDQIRNNVDFLSTTIGVDQDFVNPTISIPTISFNLLEKLFLADWFFIAITAFMGAGVVLGSYMFIDYGVGLLNELQFSEMLRPDNGDYTAALGFASSFLMARVLEGPLVGILDVGGSILTGVGLGIPAVFLSTPSMAFLMHNPFYAMIIGLVSGLVIGVIVMIVRYLKPKKMINLGTDIMIGAGNTTGKFLGPLVIIFAGMFQPLVGIGAGLGAIAFAFMKKPIVGGAVVGAMIFGLIPAFI